MIDASEVLTEAWRRNARVNEGLLDHLSPELMKVSDGHGGWTVGQHVVEMLGFRKDWLSRISPRHQEKLEVMYRVVGETFEPTTLDSQVLKAAFRDADAAALAAVTDALAAGGSFGKSTYATHPALFIQHAIVHDAHHRGQLLMTLRLGGCRWEQADDPMWAPWRE